jgi:hypothetical protein
MPWTLLEYRTVRNAGYEDSIYVRHQHADPAVAFEFCSLPLWRSLWGVGRNLDCEDGWRSRALTLLPRRPRCNNTPSSFCGFNLFYSCTQTQTVKNRLM